MILSMSAQGLFFLSTALAGAAIGLLYDIFRISRKVVSLAPWVVHMQDIIFWLLATIGTFYFLLQRNYGEIPPFALVGTLCGIVLYFATLSPFVRKISVAVINFTKKVIAAAIRCITAPIRFIYRLCAPPIKKICKKIYSFHRKTLRTAGKYGKMKATKVKRNISIMRKKV